MPTRRALLKALGWTGAGLVVAGVGLAFVPVPALPHRGAPQAADAATWLRLRPDGVIEVVLPRAEMGQGIAIAFRQIVAEETGFPLDRVVAVAPRTDVLTPVRATVGSDSVRDFGPLIARAAAALADVLRREGSEAGAPPPGGWQTIAGRHRQIEAKAITNAPPRSFTRGRLIVGHGHATDGVRAIVTASAPLYADDIRLPGMVFAAPLALAQIGRMPAAVDDGPARGLPGYLGLHRFDGRYLVAAETRGALERAQAAIAIADAPPTALHDAIARLIDVDAGLQAGSLEHTILADGPDPAGPFDLDLRLDVPMAAHAAMEPRTAVAAFADGALTVWTGSQDVTFVRNALAKALGMPAQQVTVIGMRLGGGFGGRTTCTVEQEAALLARQLSRPVKVQWTRADEFRDGFHRPPSSHRIRARLTADGRIDAWQHAFRSGHVIFTSAAMGPALQFATSFVGDPGVARGAVLPYAAGSRHVGFEDVRLPVHTGPWRGLGAAPNIWAIETAIDQLARQRSEDPLAFRLRSIAPEWPRLARVLQRVAALSGWADRRSSRDRGFGLACGIYKEMSYAAVVAEVERRDDGFALSRLWCAHDCGMVINPDQVRAQVEGNLVWGIGMALHETLDVTGGGAPRGFGDYEVPRFSDVPDIVIELVDEGEPPTGAGETAIVAAAPAITNAIAAMTGRPVLRLPVDRRGVA